VQHDPQKRQPPKPRMAPEDHFDSMIAQPRLPKLDRGNRVRAALPVHASERPDSPGTDGCPALES
jgi:hypothetical protein